jgi:hypothetical protein
LYSTIYVDNWGDPFILFNAWDAASAQAIQEFLETFKKRIKKLLPGPFLSGKAYQ